MLGIFPKDPQAIMARVGSAKAGYIKANLALGFAPVNIPQVVVPGRVEELAELIRTHWRPRESVTSTTTCAGWMSMMSGLSPSASRAPQMVRTLRSEIPSIAAIRACGNPALHSTCTR